MTYTPPAGATPRPRDVILDGRRRLEIQDVTADVIVAADAKGKVTRIRLEPGVRFDWNGDAGAWVAVE